VAAGITGPILAAARLPAAHPAVSRARRRYRLAPSSRPRAMRAVPLGLLLGRLALMKVAGAVVGVALGLAITWVAGRLGDAGARARARRARARPADLPPRHQRRPAGRLRLGARYISIPPLTANTCPVM
jgi:hypothetical protein